MNPTATINLLERLAMEIRQRDPRKTWSFEDNFRKRALVEADMDPAAFSQAAQRLLSAANTDWKASGTNMTSALATFSPDGGLVMTTAGANNDQALLSPSTVNGAATQLSGIGGSTGAAGVAPWLAAKEPHFEAIVRLSSVAAVRFVAGFKLTTDPTLTTDNDQVMFSFDTASGVNAARWRCVTSVANVDTDTVENSGAFTLVAATDYRLQIRVASDRKPAFLINDQLVGTGPALTTPMAFIPVIGVQALAVAAKAFTIRRGRLSRLF